MLEVVGCVLIRVADGKARCFEARAPPRRPAHVYTCISLPCRVPCEHGWDSCITCASRSIEIFDEAMHGRLAALACTYIAFYHRAALACTYIAFYHRYRINTQERYDFLPPPPPPVRKTTSALPSSTVSVFYVLVGPHRAWCSYKFSS